MLLVHQPAFPAVVIAAELLGPGFHLLPVRWETLIVDGKKRARCRASFGPAPSKSPRAAR
jgi:hypothetical protein